jgi:CubicO group peptidase (beta-lactamase class C family)
LLRQFQAQHKVPSIAVSVTVDNATVLAQGLNLDGSIASRGEAVRYNIGSVTKQFTAAAILALIQDKAIVPSTNAPLTLDTPGIDIFPTLDRNSEGAKITLRRVLTMTSNIPSYTDDDVELKADQSGIAPAARSTNVEEIIERLKAYRIPDRPPKFEYSNTNYFMLALVIGVLTHGYEPTAEPVARNYIRRRILAKAGMKDTGFVGEPLPADAVAAPPHYLHPRLFDQEAWPRGAGDMVSTVADLARWNLALRSGEVIDQALFRTMITPAEAVTTSAAYSGCSYAMGWYVCKRAPYTLYQHDGMIAGFMASNGLAQDRDGSWMSATVLANTDDTIDIVELVRNIIKLGTR